MRKASLRRLAFSFLAFVAVSPLVAQCDVDDARLWCADLATPGMFGTPTDGDKLGFALAFVDFNGDGRDDLAVGAPFKDDSEGHVYVLRSDGAALSNVGVYDRGLSLTEASPDSQFGHALARRRNLAQGAVEDLIVGAPLADRAIDGPGCGPLEV